MNQRLKIVFLVAALSVQVSCHPKSHEDTSEIPATDDKTAATHVMNPKHMCCKNLHSCCFRRKKHHKKDHKTSTKALNGTEDSADFEFEASKSLDGESNAHGISQNANSNSQLTSDSKDSQNISSYRSSVSGSAGLEKHLVNQINLSSSNRHLRKPKHICCENLQRCCFRRKKHRKPCSQHQKPCTGTSDTTTESAPLGKEEDTEGSSLADNAQDSISQNTNSSNRLSSGSVDSAKDNSQSIKSQEYFNNQSVFGLAGTDKDPLDHSNHSTSNSQSSSEVNATDKHLTHISSQSTFNNDSESKLVENNKDVLVVSSQPLSELAANNTSTLDISGLNSSNISTSSDAVPSTLNVDST